MVVPGVGFDASSTCVMRHFWIFTYFHPFPPLFIFFIFTHLHMDSHTLVWALELG